MIAPEQSASRKRSMTRAYCVEACSRHTLRYWSLLLCECAISKSKAVPGIANDLLRRFESVQALDVHDGAAWAGNVQWLEAVEVRIRSLPCE